MVKRHFLINLYILIEKQISITVGSIKTVVEMLLPIYVRIFVSI
jgi:hypothetical protein